MRIATWNVNSVRARIANVTGWLAKNKPDVVLLQEIKCESDAFPRFEFEALGYQCHVVGQKSYNGVALLSLHSASDVLTTLPADSSDEQARYVQATIQGLRIASLYLPNGNPVGTEKFDYKLAWMARLKAHCAAMLKDEIPFILGGDYNVLPAPQDAYDPAGWEADALFHPRTRAAFREILNLGLTEAFRALHGFKLNPASGGLLATARDPAEESLWDRKCYTFWDYQGGAWQRNLGLRIDHFLLSPEAADRLKSCTIDPAPRGEEKASDHVPVVVEVSG